MGALDPSKQQARVSSTLYHAANFLPGTTASYWQMRTNTQRAFKIPFAKDGVIDIGLALHNTLTAAGVGVNLTANLQAFIDLTDAGGAEKGSQPVWTGTLPPDARFTFVSEKGTTEPGTVTQKIIEVPELRMPIHSFYLYLTPQAVPDAGDFYMRLIRRY